MNTRPAKPARWTEYVGLDEVLRAPRNPKNHNTSVLESSISRFGYVEHVTVDERTGRLVAGHGRLDQLQASRDAGDDPPDGVSIDADGNWMIPVNRGWASRSDQDAEAYLIMSNQSTIIGGWDEPELAQLLAELRDADLLDFTGFTDDDVSDLTRRHGAAPDLDDFAKGLGAGEENAGWPTITIKVPHHISTAWEAHLAGHDDDPAKAMAALLNVDPDPPAWEPDLTRQAAAQPPADPDGP